MANPADHDAPADPAAAALLRSGAFEALVSEAAQGLVDDPAVDIADARLAEAALLGSLRGLLSDHVRDRVRLARAAGLRWEDIGVAFNISRGNAYNRFSEDGVTRNRHRKRVQE